MEQKPATTAARDRILHIPVIKLHLCRPINPVTLEHRCVRMLQPSDKEKSPQQPPRGDHLTVPSSSTPLSQHDDDGAAVRDADESSAPKSLPSGTQNVQTSPATTTAAAAATAHDVKATVIPTDAATTSATAAVSGPVPPISVDEILGDLSEPEALLDTRTDSSPGSSKRTASPSRPSSKVLKSALKTSDPYSSPLPPSPILTTALGDGREKEDQSTAIVGGKRPLVEERLTLTIPDLHFGDEVKDASRSPRSDSDGSASSWSQPHTQRSSPASTTSTLSTSEQLLPGDQPFRDKSHSDGKINVQFSLSPSPKRDEAHVMEFFQEQEKNLQERFLSLPKQPPRKQRSPSPNVQQKLGLEHLDNLVKLMQQLTSLKDENSRLRKRCDYLESTKNLLQAKKDINIEGGGIGVVVPSPSVSTSGSAKLQKQHPHYHHYRKQQQQQHLTPAGTVTTAQQAASGSPTTRPRLSSAGGFDRIIQSVESSSDQRPKQHKKPLHKRSFSTGSIEVDLFDKEGEVMSSDDKSRSKADGKSGGTKQKSKSSKWARVKKVLTGQKLYEDLNTTIKSLKELGRSSHFRYSSAGAHGHGVPCPSPRPSVTRTYRRSDSIPTFSHDDAEDYDPQSSQPTYSGYQVMETTEALDLSSDIWMGPADWWEEYEANKESATSASSDVSSVIEVTTMYLSSKSDDMSTSQTTSTSTSSSSSATTTTAASILKPLTQERLTVESAFLQRRKSSPHLSLNDDDEDDASLLEGLAFRTEPVRFLHKSSSCKSAELDLPKVGHDGKDPTKKFHKTAWGRVKDIIHTRKDSMSKRKPRREKLVVYTEPEESSEVDMDTFLDESWHHDLFAEGLLGRSTPRSSPMVIRQSQAGQGAKAVESSEPKAMATSLPKSMSTSSGSGPSSSTGPVDMAALLGRSISDDFNKKMQQWEEKKSRKSVKASVDDSEICSLDVSIPPPDLLTLDLKDLSGPIPEVGTESLVTEDSNTSIEVAGLPSIYTEDGPKKKMTESFSRKMQEWERMKYKGSPSLQREGSPEMERKGSKGKKEERQKSKRSREEKEKEKMEKQREREMQKVEREQIKLKKEKLRIEKERLRTLEREAKLEKLKGRLNQQDLENVPKNPVLSPLAEYKVTDEFAHKLHEWELRKGLSHAVSNSVYLEAQKMRSMHQIKEGLSPIACARPGSARFTFDPASVSPDGNLLPVQSSYESADEASPIEKLSELSMEDTSLAEECPTTSNIPTLERANAQLLQQLRKKELEYHVVQEEVTSLNRKLTVVKEEHAAEMARFHQELNDGVATGPVKLEMGELERVMGDVEEKIKVMESVGETIAMSMESAAVGKWQSIEGEESVHMQLVELVAQMRNMLIQATQSEEASQKTSALTNFEVLYSQAMKLQVQMNNLRLSHLERNREIMVIKRQLLLQEVNNLVLQADISRREVELYQFQEAKRFSTSGLRRWNTFSGQSADRQRPQAQIELPASVIRQRAIEASMRSAVDKTLQSLEEKSAAVPLSSTPTQSTKPSSSEGNTSRPAPKETFGQGQPEVTSPPRQTQESSTDKPESVTSEAQSSETFDTHKPSTKATTEDAVKQQTVHPELPSFPASKDDPNLLSPSEQQQEDSDVKAAATITGTESGQGKFKKEKVKGAAALRIPKLTEYKTQFDSVPIQQEIEALRKEKSKVEKGSPTLRRQAEESRPSPALSPGPSQADCISPSHHETQSQTIPKQPCLDVKPRLQKAAQIIDEDFPTAQSVMECTEHSPTTDHTTTTIQPTAGTIEGATAIPASPPSPSNLSALPPIADQTRTGSRSPRSPVSKHKLLRRQKEKEETAKPKDYSAISPRGSPIATRGKPPLPRQERAVRRSPSTSPCVSEKGARTKSHGDVESVSSCSSVISKPLSEPINKFEKRATICETEDRPLELRKTPSPTLHLPRVGLVSRVRKLKPAAELLEESQRYRSGQSIYATRIMKKYLPKDEKKETESSKANKENIAGCSYVQTMVQRLSRESTPVKSTGSSRTTSNSSLHWTDTQKNQSEFVSQIAHKLSSPHGESEAPSSPVSPLSDVTNGHTTKSMSQSSLEKPSSEPDRVKPRTGPSSSQHAHARRSCEVAMVLSSSSSTELDPSFTILSAVSTQSVATCHNISSTTVTSAIPTNHQSLPTLPSSSQSSHHTPSSSSRGGGAGRRTKAQKKDVSFEIEPEFSSLTSASSVFRSPSEEEEFGDGDYEDVTKRSKEKRQKGQSRRLLASLSPVRKVAGRGRFETVGVLCKQSISFDLGVSMYAKDEEHSGAKRKGGPTKSRKPRSWDPSESVAAETAAAAAAQAPSAPSTSLSTSAIECGDVMTSSGEGEVAPLSPTASPMTEEKKKYKRFLDSTWLQKSKKFFKVSK